MNYQNYFPASYQPLYNQQVTPQTVPMQTPQQQIQYPQMQQSNNNSINWIQGEAGAKAYMVAPGQSVLLMDSDDSVFYIKSADASGMPLPLRIFDYTERTQQRAETPIQLNADNNQFITRDEFERRIAEILDIKKNQTIKKERVNKNESAV